MFKIVREKPGHPVFEVVKDGRVLARIWEEDNAVRVEPVRGGMEWVDCHLMEAPEARVGYLVYLGREDRRSWRTGTTNRDLYAGTASQIEGIDADSDRFESLFLYRGGIPRPHRGLEPFKSRERAEAAAVRFRSRRRGLRAYPGARVIAVRFDRDGKVTDHDPIEEGVTR